MTEHPLIPYLRARWDEEEAELRAMAGGALVQGYLRHHGDRLLVDVDSKRLLVDAALLAEHDLGFARARPPADPAARAELLAKLEARWAAWSYVLQQLAAPYADRDDYPAEERPMCKCPPNACGCQHTQERP